MEYNHKCIKCGADYQDTDPDPYYCEPCNEERKAIAREIDRKFPPGSSRVQQSTLAQYDAIRREKGVNFVNIRDLGITL